MNFFHLFSAFLLALFLTSCSTTADTKKIDLREFSNDDEQYALTETREFTAQFCKSLKDGNFSHWQQVMPLNTWGITVIDYIVMIIAAILPLALGIKGKISRKFGVVLFLGFIAYTWFLLTNQIG